MSENTKEQILIQMYQSGLLDEDDTKKYLSDESVNASQMNEMKQILELCREVE